MIAILTIANNTNDALPVSLEPYGETAVIPAKRQADLRFHAQPPSPRADLRLRVKEDAQGPYLVVSAEPCSLIAFIGGQEVAGPRIAEGSFTSVSLTGMAVANRLS